MCVVGLAGICFGLVGCGQPGQPSGQNVLFDGARPAKEMYHVTVVNDPFGGRGTVLAGGPLGPTEPNANKGTFINPAGFFVMPPSGKAELHVRVAVRKVLELKVEVTARGPAGSQKFRQTLIPDRWQTVVVPLDAALIKPGATVFDITIFQVGKDPKAELYVKSVRLVAGGAL